MGVHYPFGYSGYESRFLDTFIYLIDNYCSSCHTNRDVKGNCKKCPIGNLIFASKDYLLKTYESDISDEGSKIIKSVKAEIKKIEPRPAINATFIFEKKGKKDILLPLRELNKDLTFLEEQRIRDFMLRQKAFIPTKKRTKKK